MKRWLKLGQHFTYTYPWRPLLVMLLFLALLRPQLLYGSSARFTPLEVTQDIAGWTLVWSDEFNEPNGSGVNPQKWTLETGGWGWGNNELEYYTNRLQNAYLENGSLVIKAINETYTGPDGVTRNFTSARLKTQDKFAQAYGRFEARIKIPYGQGIWPAFWMLGNDIPQIGWPRCGEIDIMENIGKEPSTVHGTIHGPGYSGGAGIGAAYTLPNGERFADAYHIYAIEWQPELIRWYVDGNLYKTVTKNDLPAGGAWVFNHPFFLLLNVAVGGNWPGNPDASTVFPQIMLVDYVRVYQPRTVSVSAASYSGLALATGSIAAAFGANLATTTQLAPEVPLPTSLAGATVKIKDSSGTERLAPLFFVSPAQINYQNPPGTIAGEATVTITSGDGAVSIGTVQVAPVAPGLFAANADGQGVAAAITLRIRADNSQVFEPVSRFDSEQNKIVPVPIDLGPASEQVFLVLYGTGIRYRSSLSTVTVNLGGFDAQVGYAGTQDDFIGLDQINVRIPRELAGRGDVFVNLRADGIVANTVLVNIK
jgi:uncharacterized protein (TIGR03437 family)